MKGLINIAIISLLLLNILAAQSTDTTIYTFVEQMPRFPGCETMRTTDSRQLDSCAQKFLLEFLSRNVKYPEEARNNNIEGNVVVGFVVEKDGKVSNTKILKDIGGGCGTEAIRVLNAMNDYGIRWIPGKHNGALVRTKFSLPVRFRISEQPAYTIVGKDSVYYQPEVLADFIGGDSALINHMNKRLDYPKRYKDSCNIGAIDLTLILRPDGSINVADLIDYNNLGYDFWYEAIAFAHTTKGKWSAAQYKGKPVTSTYPLRIIFRPTNCTAVLANYDKANALSSEAMKLNDAGKLDDAASKLSEAITLLPNDMELLYMRGMVYLNNNKFPEACADLKAVKNRVIVTWFENIIPMICR